MRRRRHFEPRQGGCGATSLEFLLEIVHTYVLPLLTYATLLHTYNKVLYTIQQH